MLKKSLLFMFILTFTFIIIVFFISNTHLPIEIKSNYSGKVIDMNTKNPMEGVNVVLDFDNGEKEIVTTDENGLFSINPNNLSVKKVSANKHGYLFIFDGDSTFSKESLNFVGWKADPLNIMDISENILFSRVSVKGTRIALGEHFLSVISEQSDPYWRLGFTLEDGRLNLSTDRHALFAPLKGYNNKLVFEASESESRGIHQLLYFRDNKPEIKYGWIEFEFKPFSSKGPTIYLIDWGVNHTGDRDLRHQSDGYSNLILKSDLIEYKDVN